MGKLDLLEQLKPVELASLQPDIEENQVRPAIGDFRQSTVAVAGGARFKAFIIENTGDQFPDVRFVIDDQYVIRHELRPLCQLPVTASGSGLVSEAGASFACPEMENLIRTHAPRAPGRSADASCSSIRPP